MLEMQIPGPHPRTADTKTLVQRPSNLGLNKICRWSTLTSARVGELLIWIKLYYTSETTEPGESSGLLEMTLVSTTARTRTWASHACCGIFASWDGLPSFLCNCNLRSPAGAQPSLLFVCALLSYIRERYASPKHWALALLFGQLQEFVVWKLHK